MAILEHDMFKLRAKIMIEQYHKMNLNYIPRSIWRGCSMSTSCQALPSAQVKITNNLDIKTCLCFLVLKGDPTFFLPTCSLQKLSCADTCLAEQREEMERKERERRRCEHLVNVIIVVIVFIIIIFDLFEDLI